MICKILVSTAGLDKFYAFNWKIEVAKRSYKHPCVCDHILGNIGLQKDELFGSLHCSSYSISSYVTRISYYVYHAVTMQLSEELLWSRREDG